mgnify:CR=1 FL=1
MSRNLKDFSFYLDAWHYCWKNNVDMIKIQKKSFRLWNIEGVYD